jgi:hypothetical protein
MLAVILSGCASASPSTPLADGSIPTNADKEVTSCPNPHGGECLGLLDAGRYKTKAFIPRLHYSVPDGWLNLEDLPGNFLVLRASDPLDEIGAGNYIGVYQSVHAAARDCAEEPEPGIGQSAAELAVEIQNRDGVEVLASGRAKIGPLTGYTIDLRIDPAWTDACLEGLDLPVVPLIIGSGVSQLHHVLVPQTTTRLVILDWQETNIVIEVSSLNDQNSLEEYLDAAGPVIDSFAFEGGKSHNRGPKPRF